MWIRTLESAKNRFERAADMAIYTLRLLSNRTTRSLARPDVIVGSSVHPLAAAAGAILARRFKVPFVFEVRDLWPQTLVDIGFLREKSFVTWALRKLESWLYREAKRIVVLMPYASTYIVPLGISDEKIEWIPNGVDLSLYPEYSKPVRGDDKRFTLMYLGAHGFANGLDNLLLAMKLVEDRYPNLNVILRMIGTGSLKPELIELAKRLELRSVSFEPAVPKDQVPKIASQADAFVICVLGLQRLYKYGMSMNKLFDYMASGRPTVIACDEKNNPIAVAGGGVTVPANQPELLAGAIARLVTLPAQEREAMAASARAYVEQQHSFDRLAEKLALVLNMASKS